MTETLEALVALQSSALDFARGEFGRLAAVAEADMIALPATGIFHGTIARHMWDEYCWGLQEGPFDDDHSYGELPLGSVSGALDDIVRVQIEGCIEKLPRHVQVFLTALAIEESEEDTHDIAVGSIWMDGMVKGVLERVNASASSRHLELIGPNRSEEVAYHVSGSGIVFDGLSEGGSDGFLAQNVDSLLDPDVDVTELAGELVDDYMTAAKDIAEGTMLEPLLEQFEMTIREMLISDDVVPVLQNARDELLGRLDG